MAYSAVICIIYKSDILLILLLCLAAQSCLTLCNPMDCCPPGSSVHGESLGKNTKVGCHTLLQRIFPTQGSNPGLPHCRQILYHLSYQGSPLLLIQSIIKHTPEVETIKDIFKFHISRKPNIFFLHPVDCVFLRECQTLWQYQYSYRKKYRMKVLEVSNNHRCLSVNINIYQKTLCKVLLAAEWFPWQPIKTLFYLRENLEA